MNYVKNLYNGRINRKNYGLGLLFFFLVLILFGVILAGTLASYDSTFIIIILLAIYVIFVVHILSLHVRRLHDLGKSGWKTLLLIIPLVNFIILIWLLFAKSEENNNNYGSPLPKDTKFFDALFNQNTPHVYTMPISNIRYCNKCANQLEENSKFCSKCGAKILSQSVNK